MPTFNGATCRVTLPTVLGRGDDSAIKLLDRWVSRQHCELMRNAEGIVVRDLNAKHGTYVNGVRVSETCLKSGDEIAIGLTRILLDIDGEDVQLHFADTSFDRQSRMSEEA